MGEQNGMNGSAYGSAYTPPPAHIDGPPPWCPRCGASARVALAQGRGPRGPLPIGICKSCLVIVQVVPAGGLAVADADVAPFLERVSDLRAPAVLLRARSQMMARRGIGRA